MELDPVVHAPARLRVLVSLVGPTDEPQVSFPDLQHKLGMTAGNLSVHLRKLEDAGYVEITKNHRGRIPVTFVALTPGGRTALERYTIAIRDLLSPLWDPPIRR